MTTQTDAAVAPSFEVWEWFQALDPAARHRHCQLADRALAAPGAYRAPGAWDRIERGLKQRRRAIAHHLQTTPSAQATSASGTLLATDLAFDADQQPHVLGKYAVDSNDVAVVLLSRAVMRGMFPRGLAASPWKAS